MESWAPYLEPALAQRRFSNFGPVSRRLESALAAWCGDGRSAIVTSSATAGLTAVLHALGVDGHVVLPSFTFAATAQAVLAAGLTPLFCDVDPLTWELAPECVRDATVEYDVGAVVHVRAFGLIRELRGVVEAAAAAGVPLVLDSAAAFGGSGPDCAGATAEVFSLHATKPFPVGEGGVVLASAELCEQIRVACNFGLAGSELRGRGLNGKMSEITAAVGLAVLDRFPMWLDRRRIVARSYEEALQSFEHVGLAADAGDPAWQVYPIRLPSPAHTARLVTHSAEAGVELRAYYAPALHDSPLARVSVTCGSLAVSEALAGSIVCGPVYSDMTDHEIADVLEIVTNGVEELR